MTHLESTSHKVVFTGLDLVQQYIATTMTRTRAQTHARTHVSSEDLITDQYPVFVKFFEKWFSPSLALASHLHAPCTPPTANPQRSGSSLSCVSDCIVLLTHIFDFCGLNHHHCGGVYWCGAIGVVLRCSRCLAMKRAFENAATRMAGKVMTHTDTSLAFPLA